MLIVQCVSGLQILGSRVLGPRFICTPSNSVRVRISSHYDTIELSFVGHDLPQSLTALYNTVNLFDQFI